MSVAVANFKNQEVQGSCLLPVAGCQPVAATGKGQPGTGNLITALSSPQLEGPRMLPNPNSAPAWISASTTESAERERAFFRSVYSWMFGGLLLTAFAAMWVVSSPAMQQLVIAKIGRASCRERV